MAFGVNVMAERVYWLSYRIEADPGRAALDASIARLAATVWRQMPGFLVFRSAYPLGTVAGRVRKVIDPARDLVVIGMVDYRGGWVIGTAGDDSIFDLLPAMRRWDANDRIGD